MATRSTSCQCDAFATSSQEARLMSLGRCVAAAVAFGTGVHPKRLTKPEVHLLTRWDSGRYTAPPSRQAVEQAFETLPEASVRARVKRDPGASLAPGSSACCGPTRKSRSVECFV